MLLFIPMLLFIHGTLVSHGARCLWMEMSMLLFIHVTFRERPVVILTHHTVFAVLAGECTSFLQMLKNSGFCCVFTVSSGHSKTLIKRGGFGGPGK